MKKLIFSLLITFCFDAYAQSVPGYMGKRWAFIYDGFFFPSFVNTNSAEPNYSNSGFELAPAEDEGTSLNYQHHLYAGYAVSKKMSVGVDVSYLRTYFNPAGDLIYFLPSSDYAYITYSSNPAVNAVTFAPSVRIFTNHFAPLGSYWEYKIGLAAISVNRFDYTLISSDSTGMRQETRSHIDRATSLSFLGGIGYGINRVIADRIVFSMGVDFTIMTAGINHHQGLLSSGADFSEEYAYVEPENGNTEDNQEVMLNAAQGRVFTHSIINFKLGIGILL